MSNLGYYFNNIRKGDYLILKHPSNIFGGGDPINMRLVVRYPDAGWQGLGAPVIKEFDTCKSYQKYYCWAIPYA